MVLLGDDLAGIKLSSFTSSVLTKSGREMIDALIAGQRDPAMLAEFARGRMRSKIAELTDALDGRFNAHHAMLCQTMHCPFAQPARAG